jgi:hypothetical protein
MDRLTPQSQQHGCLLNVNYHSNVFSYITVAMIHYLDQMTSQNAKHNTDLKILIHCSQNSSKPSVIAAQWTRRCSQTALFDQPASYGLRTWSASTGNKQALSGPFLPAIPIGSQAFAAFSWNLLQRLYDALTAHHLTTNTALTLVTPSSTTTTTTKTFKSTWWTWTRTEDNTENLHSIHRTQSKKNHVISL